MKTFLAVYTGTPETSEKKWGPLSDAQKKQRQEQGMKSWSEWGQKNGSALVYQGGPLGKTKRVDENGISDTRNSMAAFTIIKAESHEEAAKLFLNHPHFAIFPGDAVEIMECMPIPGTK